ncbi:MAG: arginase, partial [Burkholderiales bacterium PBB5]
MNTQISLIGAPTDIGAGSRGASMGPEAMRVAQLQPTLEAHGLQVADRGNLSGPANCREAGKKLRVLWLDAHADFNTNVLTPSGNVHGMPVACLCGHGPQALIEIGGQVPA